MTPERTCAGCRRRRPKTDLIRCQVDNGRLTVVDRPAAGRSVYLCPNMACFRRAGECRAFARTLRRAVEIDDRSVSEFERALRAREAVT